MGHDTGTISCPGHAGDVPWGQDFEREALEHLVRPDVCKYEHKEPHAEQSPVQAEWVSRSLRQRSKQFTGGRDPLEPTSYRALPWLMSKSQLSAQGTSMPRGRWTHQTPHAAPKRTCVLPKPQGYCSRLRYDVGTSKQSRLVAWGVLI